MACSLLTLLSFVRLSGQAVQFTQHDDLLAPIFGFTPYPDCVVDMDGDGLDDVVRIGSKGIYIDFQKRETGFHHRQFDLAVQSPPTWSIAAGDLDNNGFPDLVFAHTTSVSFVRADSSGAGYTEDVMPVSLLSQRSTMADINLDGWLDAFVCNDTGRSIPFRNLGQGQLIPDTSLIHTAAMPGNYAAIWVDYDLDGYTDMYLSKCLAGALPGDPVRTNLLYRNNGDGSFTENGAAAGVDDNAQSWSTSFEDFDHDGDFDAFVVNHDLANRLYRNNGDGTFTEVISASGIDAFDLFAFENATGDFNNDGHMDIFSDLTYPLYLGHGDLTFTPQDGPVTPGAIGDLNDDGFLDVVYSGKIWLNEGNSNHYVKVNAHGIISNRNGIGARIEIFGSWGRQVRELRSGQSYSPMQSLSVHFGLGQADHIDSLIMLWPSGRVTKVEDLQADSTYTIPEAACISFKNTLSVPERMTLCPGDTLECTAPDGFDTYAWLTGESTRIVHITRPGKYQVMMTDSAGCVALSAPVFITETKERLPRIFSMSGPRFCEGDSILLMASAGNQYQWSTGEENVNQIFIAEGGIFSVSVASSCYDIPLVSEPFDAVQLPAPPPLISEVYVLPGDSVLLSASGDSIHWYDEAAGGSLLYIGNQYQTPALEESVTYFLESHSLYHGDTLFGGKTDIAGDGGVPVQGGYLTFEAWEPFTLLSVEVYVPPGAPQGVRFVQLMKEDTLLASRSFTVQTGWNTLNLDFQVPVGLLSLRCPQGNLFRNVAGITYPYDIGHSGKITGTNHGSGYYYYFYNWKVASKETVCVSERVPFPVIVTSEYSESFDRMSIFPNPSYNSFWLQLPYPGLANCTLVDAKGLVVWEEQITGSDLHLIKPGDLLPGVYFLKVKTDKEVECNPILIGR